MIEDRLSVIKADLAARMIDRWVGQEKGKFVSIEPEHLMWLCIELEQARKQSAIRLLGDPILRRKAAPWTGDPIQIIRRLETVMRSANGIGLAAPQIGESVRVAVIDLDGDILSLVNPHIVWRSDEVATEQEGCLSIPGYEVSVTRPTSIVVYTGSAEVRLNGIQSRAAQHEIDHLDGVLILDRWMEQVRE